MPFSEVVQCGAFFLWLLVSKKFLRAKNPTLARGLTFSFTAGGNSFPVAVTVTGLTEKEMPPGEDFIHVEIPGMCIGGGDVGVGVGSSQ